MSIAALLAGCGTGTSGNGEEPTEHVPEPETADSQGSQTVPARLGPIRYEFDPAQLIMAEVMVEVPPEYDDQLWGMKLIPTQRADLLGQQRCRYGHPTRDQTCETHREPGLALALLTRPLEQYYQAFVKEGLEDELSPTQLDGSRGFTFTAKVDGGSVEYRFLPLRDRTVLVAWQSADGADLGHDAIRDVIRSLAEGLEAVHQEGG